MMAAPQRVVLFAKATLTVQAGTGSFPVYGFPEPKNRRSAEQQLDDCILHLVQAYRNARLRLETKTDHGDFTAEAEIRRGRFDSTRRCMAEAYISQAHAASTLEEARRGGHYRPFPINAN